MAITSIKTGSSFTNLIKYNDFLAGNTAYQPTAYESIATVTVGSGGSSTITFSSIPSTYQHLQIRAISNHSSTGAASLFYQFNSDTASNYSAHYLQGSGSSVAAGSILSTYMYAGTGYGNTDIYHSLIMDILDYKDTNKYKTVRNLCGYDANGSGYVELTSGSWRSTSAVTSISLYYEGSRNMDQYTKFGLFGIKGA